MAKQKGIIAPSILSADFGHLADEVTRVINAGAEWIHVDVMDNHYVPNLTFGPIICEALRNAKVIIPLDVHLMISPIDNLLEPFAKAGATSITFHPEAVESIPDTIQRIKDLGCKVGLAVNPNTSLSTITPYLREIDLVLAMSVFPGFAGQSFIPSVLDTIKTLRQHIDGKSLNMRLSIDGGVKLDNIQELANIGADTFVMGSAIFNADDPEAVLKNALSLIQ